MNKRNRYRMEAILLRIAMLAFEVLPLDAASNLGGWIGRTLGPRFGISKKAAANLGIAFPSMQSADKQLIIKDMWDHLGRILGEYPHLETIAKNRLVIRNENIIKNALDAGNGAIFFSAHVGNWEIHVPGLLTHYNAAAHLTYRALNNPFADELLRKYRTLNGKIGAFPKGRESGKKILSALRSKDYLAILIDQKYNEGVSVSFFSKPAMTNPVFVQLAQKYKCPLIPVQCRRLEGANFEITAYDPLKLADENAKPLPIEMVIAEAHSIIEKWIQQAPEQWLWLHNRWNSARLKNVNII